jgi:glc operon protein GlcG
MRIRSSLSFAGVLACIAGAASAQTLGDQKTITGTGARALVDACLAYAKTNNLRVGIAVVDPYGNLLDYHTMEGTNVIAGESAVLKAKTSARWWRPTVVLNQRVKDWENVAPVWAGDFPQEGGIPIFINGVIVGAMGIGGGRGDACAKAAVAAVFGKVATTDLPAP